MQVAEPKPPTGTIPVTLKVNGTTQRVQIDPRATVLDTLRETLHLTGTKKQVENGTLSLRLAAIYPKEQAEAAHRRFEAGATRGRLVLDFGTND